MSDYYNLGSYSRKVFTSSPEAQLWFDRGLTWTYAYHHEEAIECFKKVLKHDSGCVMAYWGIAYASGPNYNKQWAEFEALSQRYPEDPSVEDFGPYNDAFAHAMRYSTWCQTPVTCNICRRILMCYVATIKRRRY